MILLSLLTHDRIPSSNLLLSSHFRYLSAHPLISQCGKLSSIECAYLLHIWYLTLWWYLSVHCNSITLLGGYQVLLANPSDRDSLKMEDKHEALVEWENWNIQRKTGPSGTLFTTNLTQTGPGLSLDFWGDTSK